MNVLIRSAAGRARGLALTTLAIVFSLSVGQRAAGGVVDDSIDALYNLHDQLQDVVMKSVKGVGEASQDGKSADTGGKPWTLHDLQEIRQKHADSLNRNKTLAQQQQQLADIDARLLKKLPPDDPRRATISDELKQIASQMPETQQRIQEHTNSLNEANTAISRWKRRHDPKHVSSEPKDATDAPAPTDASSPADAPPPDNPPLVNVPVDNPPPPQHPLPPPEPKTDDGGDTASRLATLKQQEAAQEAAARSLGQERQSAVNKYIDDPSAENRAAAEAIRHQLDGMVDDWNRLRGQVDELEGTSRDPVHVRSAKGIAEEHRRRKENGTDTDGNIMPPSTGGGGGGCGGGMTSNQSTGTDNTPHESRMYEEVGPSGNSSGNQSVNSVMHGNSMRSNNLAGGHRHGGSTMTQNKSANTSTMGMNQNKGGQTSAMGMNQGKTGHTNTMSSGGNHQHSGANSMNVSRQRSAGQGQHQGQHQQGQRQQGQHQQGQQRRHQGNGGY